MRNIKIKPLLFILLIISGVGWFIYIKLSGLAVTTFVEFMKPIPKVVTVDMLLIAIFSKWFWRWKLLQGWLVPFPDLNGTWQGEIQTTWKDEHGNVPVPIPAILTIKQTFFKMSCVTRTAEMESHSYIEGFNIDRESQIKRLCYSYVSKPRVTLRDRSTPHDGTMLFNIIGKPVIKLEGEYWTQRNTTGVATFTFRTSTLLDDFPTDLPAHPMSVKSPS